MINNLEIENRENYLYLKHAPGYVITAENEMSVWAAIGQRCEELDCKRVMRESVDVVRNLKNVDSYVIGELVSRIGRGLRVAMLFKNYIPDHQTEFFQTVAENRGASIKFFTEEQAALEWLGVGS